MNYINNLKLKVKLAIVGVLIVAAFAIIIGPEINRELARITDIEQAVAMMDVAEEGSTLSHEIQKERGMSAAFLKSKGKKMGDKLQAQRGKVDAEFKKFKEIWQKDKPYITNKQFIDEVYLVIEHVEGHAKYRAKVDTLSISAGELIKKYTGTIFECIKLFSDAAIATDDHKLSSIMGVVPNYLEGIDFSGKERAVGSGIFAAEKMDVKSFVKFKEINAAKNALIHAFKQSAPKSVTALLEPYYARTDLLAQIQGYRDEIIAALDGAPLKTGASVWFDKKSEEIGLLIKTEHAIYAMLEDIKYEEMDHAKSALYTIIFMSLGVVAILVFSAWVIAVLLKNILTLTTRTDQIANGNLDAKIKINSGDEIGSLAKSLEVLRNNSLEARKLEEKQKVQQEEFNQLLRRYKPVLQNAPTNIIYADTELSAQYMNPASEETFKKLSQYMSIASNEVIGAKLDQIFNDPSIKADVLIDPKNLPYSTVISMGPESVDLLVSPLYDDDKVYMGPMVTWKVITEKLAAEQREKDQAKDMANTLAKVSQNAETLSSSSEELSSVANQMSGNSKETLSQANTVGAAAEQVSSNVANVATSAEEMSASIQEISKSANSASEVGRNAVTVATNTSKSINALGESSLEIGNVIKTITSIAQQTNLLALNATIEAARAGEAGKGFAVVANEVKELAKQTSHATEDISQKIEAIQNDTQGAVDAIAEIGNIINEINDSQTTIASAVEEQTATVNEVSRNASEAARGSSEIAENISTLVSRAENTSEGAGQTLTAAEELAKLSSDLRSIVEQGK